VEDDVPVDSEILFVIDFVNLKIKLAQSFRCTHRDRMCVRMFIGMSVYTCIRICVYTIFLKKSTSPVLTHTCCSLFIHIDLYIKIKMSDCLILQAMLSLVVINKPFRDLANQEPKPR
jgi:hypothetical protein